jgi:hypothetical protein
MSECKCVECWNRGFNKAINLVIDCIDDHSMQLSYHSTGRHALNILKSYICELYQCEVMESNNESR